MNQNSGYKLQIEHLFAKFNKNVASQFEYLRLALKVSWCGKYLILERLMSTTIWLLVCKTTNEITTLLKEKRLGIV